MVFRNTELDTRARHDQSSYSAIFFAVLALVDLNDADQPQQINLDEFHAVTSRGKTIDASSISRAIEELNKKKSRPERISVEAK